MAKVLKELAVAVSSYTDPKTGQQKARSVQIGVLMDDGKGGEFMLLNRHFNPAGVPFKPGSDKIIVSCFEPKDRNEQASNPSRNDDDEIPF